jgi:hypothetical protein
MMLFPPADEPQFTRTCLCHKPSCAVIFSASTQGARPANPEESPGEGLAKKNFFCNKKCMEISGYRFTL